MPIPSDKTSSTIVIEALRRLRIVNPNNQLITRAKDEWLTAIVSDISLKVNLKSLERTKVAVLPVFEQRVALDLDMNRVLEVKLFRGSVKGVVQGGGSASITLAADEEVSSEFIRGRMIGITSGVGISQLVRVIGYDSSTKVASVDVNWVNVPIAGDEYMIIEEERTLKYVSREEGRDVVPLRIPTRYYVYGFTPSEELHFNGYTDTDSLSILKIRYSVYFHQVDDISEVVTELYNGANSLLVQGVYVEALRSFNDDRLVVAEAKFRDLMRDFLSSNLRQRNPRGLQVLKSAGGMPTTNSRGRSTRIDFDPNSG